MNKIVAVTHIGTIRIAHRALPFFAVAIFALLLTGAMTACEGPLKRYQFSHRQMGTMFNLTFYARDDDTAAKASKAAFDRVDELNRIMSDYYRPSELNKLSATAGSGKKVKLSPDLGAVLMAGQHISEQSGGAFDVTVGPVVQLWRQARKSRNMPPAEKLLAALKAVGYQHLSLTTVSHGGDHEVKRWTEAELKRPTMKLDLGGIAKGYAGDQVKNVLAGYGVKSMMLDAGGDIRVGSPPPGEKGWKIGIAPLDARNSPPSKYVVLSNAAIATSGDAWQYVEIDGKRYSHIVNPKTGLGLTTRSSVTIIVTGNANGSNKGMAADALASAISVLGPARGLELVGGWKAHDVAAIVIVKPGDTAEVYESAKVKQLDIRPVENLKK